MTHGATRQAAQTTLTNMHTMFNATPNEFSSMVVLESHCMDLVVLSIHYEFG